ncbi:TolC family protein [Novacetimonas hansenii]|uniref:TolC family protein n=1 Tax=Novacetimonas hansenii TaxID=436 RepID=UPI0009D79591|nr:TolC family protein [Novacetimonas hansenii]
MTFCHSLRRPLARTVGFASILCMTACSVKPQPMTLAENVLRAQEDRATIDKHYVPLTGGLSISGAIARALRYNYDIEVSKLEVTQQEKNLDLTLMTMLPNMSADAGYSHRGNNNSAESISQLTGEHYLDYSYSEMPTHGTGDAQFSWDLMDAGISYFMARQEAYRALIAVERRRKAINNLVRNTSDVYWRAATAQELLPKIDPMINETEAMLRASRTSEGEHLQNPVVLLDYQANLMRTARELHRLRNDLQSAQIELRSLINVAQNTPLNLTTPVETSLAGGDMDVRKLEDIGLVMRPELRMEAYQQKIDKQDVYKEIIRVLPGIGGIGNLNFDSNSLLYHNYWGQIGVHATYNLMNLVRAPAEFSKAHGAIAVSQLRRLALSVSTLAEIHLSDQQYINALDMLRTARDADEVGRQMEMVADRVERAGAESRSDRVRHRLSGVLAEVDCARAYALAHSSLANLYESVGIDIVPANATTEDLATLNKQVDASIKDWLAGRLPELPPPANPAKIPSDPLHFGMGTRPTTMETARKDGFIN